MRLLISFLRTLQRCPHTPLQHFNTCAHVHMQVWVPNLSAAGPDPDEEKLVTVAATKCLTECGDVWGSRPLWEQLRAALDEKLKGGGVVVC